jgi:D-alanyl-D-alanine carboxypeptidase
MDLRLFSLALSAALLAGGGPGAAIAAVAPAPIAPVLQRQLEAYLKTYGKVEHISGGSLSVGLHGHTTTIDVAAGTSQIGGGAAVTPSSIFQIGSNTKAFTAVCLLRLEADGKLSVKDTIGKWVPEYPAWANVRIAQLLDMTSGIPTYDDTKAWAADLIADPRHTFTPVQLIGYIYPKKSLHGWNYSNTGYIVAQLIVERASGESYTKYVGDVIAKAGLRDTFYQTSFYPASIFSRQIAGYYDNDGPGNEPLAPLLGKNVRSFSISWTQAAGGIVSTPSDVVKWARDLYTGPILAQPQRTEQETLVDTNTGQPIASVSEKSPRGFGLGITEMYKKPIGRFFFYEGETLGYRVAHIYVPSTDTTIVVGLNSQPAGSRDHIGPFLSQIYQTLQAHGLVNLLNH